MQTSTSGLGAVFPKGLVIGHVAEAERRPYGLFQTSRLEPAADFGKPPPQSTDVFVDERGLIYIADRSGGGLHIVEYTGPR